MPTPIDLKKIIKTSETDEKLQTFIDTADLLVNEELSTKSNLSAERLEKIKLYLSAHFLTNLEKQITSEKLGDAEFSYQMPKTGMNLMSSTYGQTAISLDTSGTLEQLGEKVVEIEFL